MSAKDQFHNAMIEECGCSVCEAIARGLTKDEAFAEILKQEQQDIHNHGWYAHYVMEDLSEVPIGMNNYHTHGMVESFGHLDFQIVIPIPPKTVHDIFYTLIDLVKEGNCFASVNQSGKILNGYNVAFARATENGREVIRVILPAANGTLDRDKMTDGWELQWEETY